MASYSVAADEIAAWSKTLVAATVDTVTFTASDRDRIRVTYEAGTTDIWFTTDGTTPAANGPKSYRLRANVGGYVDVEVRGGGATAVKLISTGTPTYSVEGSL